MEKFKFRRILAMMLAIFMSLCGFTLTAEAAKPSKTTAPTFVRAATNTTGNIVTITFSKAMQDPSGQAAKFSIKIGSITQAATAATLNGTDKIDLTIAAAATNGQTVTVSYTPGTVKSADGGVLAAFTNKPVTNNVPPPQPPAVETVKYVSLGDSIATGTTGTGSTTSFANKFYNYLMNTYYPAINAGLNKTTNVEFEQDAIDGVTSLDLIDWLLSDDKIDDDPLRTDEPDRYDASMVADIANANIITLSIGGNDLMQYATIPGFATVDWAGAQNSANYFESTSWNWLISTIKSINGTKNARLIVTTGYNPYNLGTVSGYESDAQPAAKTESLVNQMRNAVISDANRLENGIAKYDVADVYTDFHTYQPNRMGQITSFYPFYLLKIMRDPHPNQTGQDRILNLFKVFYPLP